MSVILIEPFYNWNGQFDIKNTINEAIDSLTLTDGNKEKLRTFVFDSYNEPHRVYHSTGHIYYLLKAVKKLDYLIEKHEIMIYTILFHDIVYNMRPVQDEKDSAEKAKDWLYSNTDLLSSHIEQVAYNIFGKHQVAYDCFENKLFHDLDNLILAGPGTIYQGYLNSIFKEYSSKYSKEEIIRGRVSFLKYIIKGDIFKTNLFKTMYEKDALNNIIKELESYG